LLFFFVFLSVSCFLLRFFFPFLVLGVCFIVLLVFYGEFLGVFWCLLVSGVVGWVWLGFCLISGLGIYCEWCVVVYFEFLSFVVYFTLLFFLALQLHRYMYNC